MQVPIAESCFADTSADLLPAADQVSQRRGVWVDPQLDVAHKCSYDKKIYADGESWKPRDSNLACVTCSCKVRYKGEIGKIQVFLGLELIIIFSSLCFKDKGIAAFIWGHNSGLQKSYLVKIITQYRPENTLMNVPITCLYMVD